jgi:hypothetical protein
MILSSQIISDNDEALKILNDSLENAEANDSAEKLVDLIFIDVD